MAVCVINGGLIFPRIRNIPSNMNTFSSPLPSIIPFPMKTIEVNASYNSLLCSSNVSNLKKTSSITVTRSTTMTNKMKPKMSIQTMLFNKFDDLINNFIDRPKHPTIDPRHVLSSNFAPVHDELPPTPCEIIQGALPPCLDGAYIRNGSNPQFLPCGPYHMFDGDGMLHSIRISEGKATFCSRYVKTYKYKTESLAGVSLVPNWFAGFSGLLPSVARSALFAARILAGQYNPSNGIGVANTSLAFFGNHLYALCDSDLPYCVRITQNGDIETTGRYDFDGKLGNNMTAHPKIDPRTGEIFAFRCGPMRPFLTYFYFDANGNKQPDVPIFSIPRLSFFHDFFITKNYAIFVDTQLGVNNISDIIFNGGSLVNHDPTKVSRLGIIPRYPRDGSEMKWFDTSGFNIFHAINAWEEEDAIVMLAPNIMSIEHTFKRMELVHFLMEEVRVDLKTGIITRNTLSAENLEFATINPAYIAKRNKYVYAGIGDKKLRISGVEKLDVSKGDYCRECTVGRRTYGSNCFGGEPFFVARNPEDVEAEEDDGYVVSYVHDESCGVSKFMVMDAKSPSLDIVGVVKLPRRVPYGFHGLFIRESDINKL